MSRERFLMDKYALHAALGPELTVEIIDVDPVSERLQIVPPTRRPLTSRPPRRGLMAAMRRPVDEAN